MDETRGKRTIGKWWKIEWGRAKRENTRNPWADSSLPKKEVESPPDPNNRFIFETERYRSKAHWRHVCRKLARIRF